MSLQAPPSGVTGRGPESLSAETFVLDLVGVLTRTGVAPAQLTLEVVETDALDVAAARCLTELREMGCDLAIDDFGTGYSSLSRLVKLPAGTWKVDRSLTSDLVARPAAAAVVSAVVQLGRQLDRMVVVEGVEDADTLHRLHGLGCTHAQGYHLGRPLAPEDVTFEP